MSNNEEWKMCYEYAVSIGFTQQQASVYATATCKGKD